ncbi:unnamed protein product [Protopolystoma xenopodis]|uniref:Uncharacterized protein n=1 Tax=Protopolystoma xenopodis TaxID=117903 RepID=A0A3S5AYS4_9PLAT|nr:unnamed protein product [Protopolystoma xenopodis]
MLHQFIQISFFSPLGLFHQVTSHLGYGATRDTFYSAPMRPNPDCNDPQCRQRQAERRAALIAAGMPGSAGWNAEALEEERSSAETRRAEEVEQRASHVAAAMALGIELEEEGESMPMPASEQAKKKLAEVEAATEIGDASLGMLMAKMKGL